MSTEFNDIAGRPPRGEFDDVVAGAAPVAGGEFDDVVGSGLSQLVGPPTPRNIPGTVASRARQNLAGTMGVEKVGRTAFPGASFSRETPGQAISQAAATTRQSFTKPYSQLLGGTSASEGVEQAPPEAFAPFGLSLGVPPELAKGVAKSIAGAADFMQSPAGLMTAPVAGARGIAGGLVKGGFGALGAKTAIEGAQRVAESVGARDPQGAGEGIGNVLLGGAMVAPAVGEALGAVDMSGLSGAAGQGLNEWAPPKGIVPRGRYAETLPPNYRKPIVPPEMVREPPATGRPIYNAAGGFESYESMGMPGRVEPKALLPPVPEPPRRVLVTEPPTPEAEGRARYVERGPAGLLGRKPIVPPPPGEFDDIVAAEPEAAMPASTSVESPRGLPIRQVAEPQAPPPTQRRKLGRGGLAEAIAGSEEDFLGRPTTLQPTRVELSSLKTVARDRGYADPADVPAPLERKIAARRHLENLALTLDSSQGTVGRYRSENFDGTVNWVGQKSPLPKSLQQGYSYADISSIIRSGLAGEKLTPKRARFFEDLQAYALKKDGPISEEDLQSFLGDHGLALDTQAGVERAAEREAIQGEQGNAEFPAGEPAPEPLAAQEQEPGTPRATFLPQRNPADVLRERAQTLISFLNREPEEAARAELLDSQPPEVRQAAVDLWRAGPPGSAAGKTYQQLADSLRQPVEEFSPEASERQRAIEERDAAAGKRAPTVPAPVQGSLGLSEDYGRKLDQRDLGLELAEQPKIAREGAGRMPTEMRAEDALAATHTPRVLQSAKDTAKSVSDLVTGADESRMQREIGRGDLRYNLAAVDMYKQRARAQLADALKWGRSLRGEEAQFEFLRRADAGSGLEQATPEGRRYEAIAKKLLADQRLRVQATGRLKEFIQDYWPRIWADEGRAKQIAAQFFGKRPLAGPKSFLKQRTLDSFQAGIDAGLKPAFANPFEMVLAKAVEMERFIQYHKMLRQGRADGWVRTLPVDYNGPAGWAKLPNGEVYGDTKVPITEAVDKNRFAKLNQFAADLGIKTLRKPVGSAEGPIGYAQKGGGIFTRFGSDLGTLAHEIGHHLEWKYKLWEDLHQPGPDVKNTKAAAQQYRVAIDKELRALSDLRDEKVEGGIEDRSKSRISYVRSRDEKMANLVDAFTSNRQRFGEVAPQVFKAFNRFLDKHPELAKIRNTDATLTGEIRQAMVGPEGRLQVAQHWAPSPIVQLIERHLAPGIRGNMIYDAARFVGNSMNQAQLGLSAFHATAETINSMVSDIGLGSAQLVRGKPLAALGSVLRGATPLSIAPKLVEASRIIRSLKEPGPLSAELETIVRAGGRLSQDQTFVNNAFAKMRDAWQRGPAQGALSTWRAPFAAVEAVAHPIMGYLVPRLKVGAFMDMARDTIERLGPQASEHELRYHLGRDWDSIENRMGQMTYDNLFWPKTVQDLAFLGVRAVGWTAGTWREIGGGIKDVATAPVRGLKSAKDARVRLPAEEGEAAPLGMKAIEENGREVWARENLRDPLFTRRAEHALALPILVGLYGALYQYLRTGKKPESANDYFAPRTGKVNPDGSEERKQLPSYMKDVYALKEHGLIRYAAGKAHPLLTTLHEMLTNRTYYGVEIRHPDDPKMQQALDLALHVLKQYEPISSRNFKQSRDAGESKGAAVESFGGITPAPAYVSRSPALREMYDWTREHMPSAARTKEEAEHGQARRQIENFVRHGDVASAQDAARRSIAAGRLTESDADRIASRLEGGIASNMFKGMPLEEQLKVWNMAAPKERNELRGMLADKIQRSLDSGAIEAKLPGEVARIKNGLRVAIQNDPGLRQALAE